MSFAILDGVPKDSKGYDDIDAFWEAADELVGQTKSPIHADDFNYDMTYSVSDDDFEELDDYSSESENEDFDDTAPLSTLKSRSSINSVGKTRESMSYEDLLDSSGDTATVAERSVSRLSSKKSNQSTNKSISNDSIDYAADDDHLDYETTFTPLSAYSARKSNAKSDSSKLNSKSKSKLNDTAETSRRVSFGNSVRFSDISPINNEEAFDDFESNVDVSNIDTPSSRGSIAKSRSISTSSKSSKKSSPATDYDSLMKSPSQSVVSTPGSNEFTRVARYAEDSLYEGSETESEDVDTTLNTTMNSQSANISNDFIHASYLKTISPSNENYMLYKGGDGSDSDESDERASGLRRSRRATKGKKFAFWKGERPIYNMGTLVGLATAPPSERKRKIDHKRPRGVAKMRLLETEEELPEFIPPKDVKFIDRSSADNLRVWQDSEQIVTSMKVSRD